MAAEIAVVKSSFLVIFNLCGALSVVPGATSLSSAWVRTPIGNTAKSVTHQMMKKTANPVRKFIVVPFNRLSVYAFC